MGTPGRVQYWKLHVREGKVSARVANEQLHIKGETHRHTHRRTCRYHPLHGLLSHLAPFLRIAWGQVLLPRLPLPSQPIGVATGPIFEHRIISESGLVHTVVIQELLCGLADVDSLACGMNR